jgi:hypothetical protein
MKLQPIAHGEWLGIAGLGHWRKVEKARQRLVLYRLMIDLMRTVHEAYVPASEPFGVRLETCFIGLCVAVGDLDGRPFSVAKIAAYMPSPARPSPASSPSWKAGVLFIARAGAITCEKRNSIPPSGCENTNGCEIS